MIHKQFQHNTEDGGGTDVQFNIDYNRIPIFLTTIQLHSNYESGLPYTAYLEHNSDANKWQLCAYYDREIKGQVVKSKEWLNSKVANDILEKIIEIKEQQNEKAPE